MFSLSVSFQRVTFFPHQVVKKQTNKQNPNLCHRTSRCRPDVIAKDQVLGLHSYVTGASTYVYPYASCVAKRSLYDVQRLLI